MNKIDTTIKSMDNNNPYLVFCPIELRIKDWMLLQSILSNEVRKLISLSNVVYIDDVLIKDLSRINLCLQAHLDSIDFK